MIISLPTRFRKFALPMVVATSFAPQVALAACYGPNQLPAGQLEKNAEFLANPAQWLGDPKFQPLPPAGDPKLANAPLTLAARDLVASDPATLPVLIGLLSSASSEQGSAIGTGLGRAAAELCMLPEPTFAANIQQQLVASNSESAKTSYALATGNQPILSVGGGGAGSSGGIGGSTSIAALPTGGGGGNPFQFGFEGRQTVGINYFGGGVTAANQVVSPP